MSVVDERLFDVRVLSVPAMTPTGEPFAPALARAFRIDAAMAERLVREAPVVVKRRAAKEVAEGLRHLLLSLGAQVEIVAVTSAPLSIETAMPSIPAAPQPAVVGVASVRPPAPHPSAPPPRASAPPVYGGPPIASNAPPAYGSAGLPPRAPLPPPASTGLTLSPLHLAIGGALVLLVVLIGVFRVLRTTGDQKMLGNTPEKESMCRGGFCLKDGKLSERQKAKHVLVVAWYGRCVDDEYRGFLEQLADRHHGDLSVVGVGLEVPALRDRRSLGKVPQPPPDPFPAPGCSPRFDVLPIDKGYASDFLAPPVTYLCDADGSLLAVWRGGMAPQQRERLTAWLEGRPYEEP